MVSDEKNAYEVYSEVVSLSGKWSSICLALRLLPSDQKAIETAHPGNPKDCLQAVVVKWLQKGYDHIHGAPTWRKLVQAVGDPAGGDNNALAETIAKNHIGMYV